MTVSTALIAAVSTYTVDTDGPFTTTMYEAYVTPAEELLDAIDPGLPSSLYDLCHAMLICHFYFLFQRGAGSGEEFATTMGETPYLIACKKTIDEWVAGTAKSIAPTQGVIRMDADIAEFQLDGNAPPVCYDTDDIEVL